MYFVFVNKIGSNNKSRLSLIVRVNVVLNRTVVVDSDWLGFDNLCGSHLQSQSESNRGPCVRKLFTGLIMYLPSQNKEHCIVLYCIELYHVSWWYYTLVIDLIGQLCCDVRGRLSVKPWCYWLWRLVISNNGVFRSVYCHS